MLDAIAAAYVANNQIHRSVKAGPVVRTILEKYGREVKNPLDSTTTASPIEAEVKRDEVPGIEEDATSLLGRSLRVAASGPEPISALPAT